MHAAFSNIKVTVHDTIAEDDKVCVRWSCTMDHTGDGFGVPPTNRQLQATGMSIITFANGRFHEAWQNWDMLSLMHQMNGEALAPTYVAHAPATV
jgi:predicted ester cyclase